MKVENVKVQYEKEDRSQVVVQSVDVVVNSKGQIVRLSPQKSVPHIEEEDGQMPKVRSTLNNRVHVQVNKDMYEKTGLLLKMGRSSTTRRKKLLPGGLLE